MEIIQASVLHIAILAMWVIAASELLACPLAIIAVLVRIALLGTVLAVRAGALLGRALQDVAFVEITAFRARRLSDLVVLGLTAVCALLLGSHCVRVCVLLGAMSEQHSRVREKDVKGTHRERRRCSVWLKFLIA
jgi:hypothetical protein